MDKDREGILLLFFGHQNSFWFCFGCDLSWLRVKSWLDSMHCINVGGGGAISTGRKGSPLIVNDILDNQPRLCQPSDQSKENRSWGSLVLCLAFLLVCCLGFLVTGRSDNNCPNKQPYIILYKNMLSLVRAWFPFALAHICLSRHMCEGHLQGTSWHGVALCHEYRHWDGKQGALPIFAIFWQLPACLREPCAKEAGHIWAWRTGRVVNIINSEECEEPGRKSGRGTTMKGGEVGTSSGAGTAEWEKARDKDGTTVVRGTPVWQPTGSKGVSALGPGHWGWGGMHSSWVRRLGPDQRARSSILTRFPDTTPTSGVQGLSIQFPLPVAVFHHSRPSKEGTPLSAG